MGLADLVNKALFDQLGLEFWLNLSLEDFPGVGGWGVGVEQKWKYSSAQLGPELGNINNEVYSGPNADGLERRPLWYHESCKILPF